MGFLIIDWSKPDAMTKLKLYTVLIVAGYVVLWFYWKGKEWARLSVLATCLICLVNLFSIGRQGRITDIMIVAEAGIALFLLFWLNTSKVILYFRQ